MIAIPHDLLHRKLIVHWLDELQEAVLRVRRPQLHFQRVHAEWSFSRSSLPHAEHAAVSRLSLRMFSEWSKVQQRTMIEAVVQVADSFHQVTESEVA